ncbi:GGDEF domain-containing protein [Lysinibacillus sp. BW-2-10]|nr:sensor domain-containing diguanylate cyclase [Lysinibacillus sp. BW-2-10]TSI08684.1 GGDEF domain-containing protein [Lysinibacillus sp. BW-2-10]
MDQWLLANGNSFNSIFSTDEKGVLLWLSPMEAGGDLIKPGTNLSSDKLIEKALLQKRPFVSHPYLSQTGRLLLLISYPIFNGEGQYKGTANGTIYMEDSSSLNELLKSHAIQDNSSSFVVDNSGKIIFHTDPSNINVNVSEYPIMDIIMSEESGSTKFVGNLGIEYFTGYAYMPSTDWVVVSQTPASIMDQPLQDLFKKMIFHTLPLIIIILVISFFITNRLSNSITKLAEYSRNSIKDGKVHEVRQKITLNSYVKEVIQLYHDIQEHILFLTEQNQKDGLTGIGNRRMFDSQIKDWVDSKTTFALIILDIDFFKKVNDTYGHLVGDDVIKYLAHFLQEQCGKEDRSFRYGGEEFILLLKDITLDQAYERAENIRKYIAETNSPTGKPINISLGITVLNENDTHPKPIIERADTALYYSKQHGRNQATLYENI